MTHLAHALRLLEQSSDDCISWPGATDTDGYGQVTFEGSKGVAHRIVWEMTKGSIPSGMQIDHLCRVRNCVNVRHMELVTCQENVARMRHARYGYNTNETCPSGHPRTPENVGRTNRGYKYCRVCGRAAAKRRRRQAALAAAS